MLKLISHISNIYDHSLLANQNEKYTNTTKPTWEEINKDMKNLSDSLTKDEENSTENLWEKLKNGISDSIKKKCSL